MFLFVWMIRFLDVVFLVLLFLHICISTQILLPILTTNPFTRAAVYVPPLRKNQSSPCYGDGHFSLWALASRGFSAAEFRSHCFRPTHPFRYVSVRFAFQSLIKRAGVGRGHGKRFQAVSQQTRSVRLRLFFFSFVLSLSGGGCELADPLSRLCFWRQFRVVG